MIYDNCDAYYLLKVPKMHFLTHLVKCGFISLKKLASLHIPEIPGRVIFIFQECTSPNIKYNARKLPTLFHVWIVYN